MIGVTEHLGSSPRPEAPFSADALRLAVLGAWRMKGRKVTPAVRTLARDFAQRAVSRWADAAVTVAMLGRLRLEPDDVLPPDDAQLAEVMRLGREADSQ